MATGNEILAYTGNAAGGIASSPGATGAYGESNTQPLSDINRSIALNSFARNRLIFEQKIKDRDAAFRMLDDDQLVLDNILEEHRPLVDGKIQKVKDIFMKAEGDIYGDPQTYREFQSAIQDAKNHIKQAQKWHMGITAEMKEKAKVGNPIDQAKYDQHVNKEKQKDFWAVYNPYAPVTDYGLDIVAAPFKTAERTYEDGLYNVKETLPDVRSTMNEYRGNFLQNKYNHWFKKYVDDMIAVPNADDLVNRVQQGIERLNSDTGAQPGDPNYVEPLKVQKDVAGRYQLLDDYGTAAAKIKLSEAKKVVTREFDPQRSARDLKLKDQAIDRATLGETIRHNKATEGVQRGQLQLQEKQWEASLTGGTSTQINGAMQRAKRIVEDLRNLADANGVISPDKIRQLNSEQLKYLGVERPVIDASDNVKGTSFQPLSLGGTEDDKAEYAIQVDNKGNIRVLRGTDGGKIKLTENGTYVGQWDNTKSTNIYNVATNIVNEELKTAGAKELNAYWRNVDDPNAPNYTGPGTTKETGASRTSSGSSSAASTPVVLTAPPKANQLKYGQSYTYNGVTKTWTENGWQ